ncbi:hypothetical protein C8R45DRAFT_1090817 [Mycena sanguinolenta]|nr:hypothetical protein C8R45DRAFT_1090817 [Mycena sanguinolenta]
MTRFRVFGQARFFNGARLDHFCFAMWICPWAFDSIRGERVDPRESSDTRRTAATVNEAMVPTLGLGAFVSHGGVSSCSASSSTSSFARLHPTRIAGGVLLLAHRDLPPFPVRDATLACAPFTRTVLRVPGRQRGPFATSSATSSSIITTCDRDAHQAQYHIPSITTLRTQAQHYEDYDARFVLKHHCTIGAFSAAPLPTLARATHCGGSGQLFRGLVQHALHIALPHAELADALDLATMLILLREGGGVAVWRSRLFTRRAFPLPVVFVSPPSSAHPVYDAPSPVLFRRSLDGRRTNESVHTPTDD